MYLQYFDTAGWVFACKNVSHITYTGLEGIDVKHCSIQSNSYRLSIVTIALSLIIRPQCNLPSNVCSGQTNRGWVTLGQSLRGRGWSSRDDLVETWRKRNHVDIFCRLNTMHERDRQTVHGTSGNIDRNSRNQIAC